MENNEMSLRDDLPPAEEKEWETFFAQVPIRLAAQEKSELMAFCGVRFFHH